MKKIIFAMFFFVLAACSGTDPANTPATISTDAVEQTPLSTPITLFEDLVPSTTYTEFNLGYAFDYPESWTINAVPDVVGSTVTIHSWDPESLTGPRPQSEGIPEDGEKLDITPLTNFGLNYEQALPWFRDQNVGKAFTEELVTLPSGASGILFVFEKTEDVGVRCLLTQIQETPILACGLAWQFQYFESIAFSLRPAD